jgi:lipid A 3-O-deacylase
MFTPRDLTLDMPDPDDRPYAGMLLFSLGLVGSNHNLEKRAQADRFDSLVYSIGVVGPSSRADDIQRWLHNYQEGIEPRGWRAQIDDRVVAGLAYQQTRRVFTNDAFDVFGHAGFSLGSIQTHAGIGGSIRVGYQRPVDFGLSRLAPSLPGSGYFRTNHPWGVYAFVGGEQRYVAYDVTLDESPRQGANNIRRRDWVGDVQVGAAFYYGRFRASYTHIWRSEQFHTQREGDGFGAIAIGLTLGGGPP